MDSTALSACCRRPPLNVADRDSRCSGCGQSFVTPSPCAHALVRAPRIPVPDWSARCPSCREYVRHDGQGGFVTVRESNAIGGRERLEREVAPRALELACQHFAAEAKAAERRFLDAALAENVAALGL